MLNQTSGNKDHKVRKCEEEKNLILLLEGAK